MLTSNARTGGDAHAPVAGMSSAPEATVACHCGIKVFAMSLITNVCVTEYDCDDAATNHEEVLEVGRRRSADMQRLVKHLLATDVMH